MVQLAGETKLTTFPGDHRADLADSLPDHPHQFWIRVRADVLRQSRLAGGCVLSNIGNCSQVPALGNDQPTYVDARLPIV